MTVLSAELIWQASWCNLHWRMSSAAGLIRELPSLWGRFTPGSLLLSRLGTPGYLYRTSSVEASVGWGIRLRLPCYACMEECPYICLIYGISDLRKWTDWERGLCEMISFAVSETRFLAFWRSVVRRSSPRECPIQELLDLYTCRLRSTYSLLWIPVPQLGQDDQQIYCSIESFQVLPAQVASFLSLATTSILLDSDYPRHSYFQTRSRRLRLQRFHCLKLDPTHFL